ncbi:hypothetical protein Sjap_003196 [Stephania japonica]|uniref:Uncharacterized protein n=1 Tax=Stephania japonica TaxID=461633 RepID=A0AAP0KNG3_9MAGN
MVLKYNFNEVAECLIKNYWFEFELNRGFLRWGVLNAIVFEDFLNDIEVLSELERGFRVSMGSTVNAISKLPIGSSYRVNDFECASDVDHAIMIRPLWIRASCAGCQVPPEGPELIERPCPPSWRCGQLRRWRGLAAFIGDQTSSKELVLGEPCGGNHVVPFRLLVSGDQDRVTLAEMNV